LSGDNGFIVRIIKRSFSTTDGADRFRVEGAIIKVVEVGLITQDENWEYVDPGEIGFL
jgi:hypothetical protein